MSTLSETFLSTSFSLTKKVLGLVPQKSTMLMMVHGLWEGMHNRCRVSTEVNVKDSASQYPPSSATICLNIYFLIREIMKLRSVISQLSFSLLKKKNIMKVFVLSTSNSLEKIMVASINTLAWRWSSHTKPISQRNHDNFIWPWWKNIYSTNI
jgi:hypothetical protein